MITKQDVTVMSSIAVLLDIVVASVYFKIQMDRLNPNSDTNLMSDAAGLVLLLYGVEAIFIGGLLGGLIRKNNFSLVVPPVFYLAVFIYNLDIATTDPVAIIPVLFIVMTIIGVILTIHTVAMMATGKIAEKTYQKPVAWESIG